MRLNEISNVLNTNLDYIEFSICGVSRIFLCGGEREVKLRGEVER